VDRGGSAIVSSSANAAALAAEVSLGADLILARARGENFPVAPRWLPRKRRADLVALYGFARLVDEIGDAAQGDRKRLLDEVAADLTRAYAGEAQHPLLQRLTPTLRRLALPRAPFDRLIEANRRDQGEVRIASWEELMAYCALSANPVGELVLRIFEQADDRSVYLSDRVCSALQVIEHCQDVAEDLGRGRVYLPAADLAALGCRVEDIARVPAPRALRDVIALEIVRARGLLQSARPLLRRLRGAARLAVAGFAAGGLATCDALEAAGWDPNASPIRGTAWRRVRHACAL
jgi:phytoene synthase